jgi:hypothetical protein
MIKQVNRQLWSSKSPALPRWKEQPAIAVGCSRSAGTGVHDGPELKKGRSVIPAQIEKAFTLRRNRCSR